MIRTYGIIHRYGGWYGAERTDDGVVHHITHRCHSRSEAVAALRRNLRDLGETIPRPVPSFDAARAAGEGA